MNTERHDQIFILTTPASPLTHPAVSALWNLGFRQVRIISEGDRQDPDVIRTLTERTNGQISFSSPVEYEKYGIPFYFTRDINGDSCVRILSAFAPDLLLNCGIPKKLAPVILSLPRLGALNCHPGLLPKYRGRSPVEWSLWNGDEVGASVHFMTENLDAGPVVTWAPLSIAGLGYHEIRAHMIRHQSRVLAESARDVLLRNEPWQKYPPQEEGTTRTSFPKNQLRELSSRRF